MWSMACFFGIPGGRGWERTFHCYSRIHEVIMGVTDTILKKAFEDEVIATIKHKMKDKYSDDEIDEFIKNIKTNNSMTYLRSSKELVLL